MYYHILQKQVNPLMESYLQNKLMYKKYFEWKCFSLWTLKYESDYSS